MTYDGYRMTHKRIILFTLIILLPILFLAACGGTTPTPSPTRATATPVLQRATFVPIEGDVVNPERGFRYYMDNLTPEGGFSTYRQLGTSLVFAYSRLDDYRERDLPPEFLDRLREAFKGLREGGIKVVLRFAYNNGPYPRSQPDASLDQILRHIEQLKPVLRENADVIVWLQAGFIGAWGEWHTSTHRLDRDMEAKKAVLYALLDALPQDRMVQLRYPWDIIRLFPEPLGPEEAFSGTPKARVGFHNDCFLSSPDDVGTYSRSGRNTREEDEAYLARMTRFTPVGGETCRPYPELQQCDVAIAEMERLHFSELNLSYHPRVIRYWQRQGCFEEIKRRLGYRLVLREVTFPARLRPGEPLDLVVRLTNEGFASPINPRPLFLVLDGPTTQTLPVESVDPRRWLPGDHTVSLRITLPETLPEGTYTLALWLPDKYENLRSDPRYSIRFANEGVWNEEKGWNVIGTVEVGNNE